MSGGLDRGPRAADLPTPPTRTSRRFWIRSTPGCSVFYVDAVGCPRTRARPIRWPSRCPCWPGTRPPPFRSGWPVGRAPVIRCAASVRPRRWWMSTNRVAHAGRAFLSMPTWLSAPRPASNSSICAATCCGPRSPWTDSPRAPMASSSTSCPSAPRWRHPSAARSPRADRETPCAHSQPRFHLLRFHGLLAPAPSYAPP
jgi:hypothetical protein